MLRYRYIVLMVYPPTYYMLISQLNSTSTSFYNLTLFFRLFYFTLFLSIYINYMYIALFLQITIKNQKPSNVAVIYETRKNQINTNKQKKWYRIPNTYWKSWIVRLPKSMNPINKPTTKQSADFLHNTLWWHGTYPVQPWTTIRCSHSR